MIYFKNYALVVYILIVCMRVMGQDQHYVGVTVNVNGTTAKSKAFRTEMQLGYGLGLVYCYSLNSWMGVRSELSYNVYKSKFEMKGIPSSYSYHGIQKISFVEIPVVVVFYPMRLKTVSPYIEAGTLYSLATRAKIKENIRVDNFPESNRARNNDEQFARHDYSVLSGLGFKYKRILCGVRLNYAITSILNDKDINDKIYKRVYSLAVSYGF